ncbi:hypothetical protein Y1Q_0021786 [Alligator mississippiensis]|uniref:Uncharacterized protein n=1 Tax=Alligator mississippiensis TaxID=8496 RepID=A0A151PB97_ALLMI|nr:hypothetical protein Y1Q_0021786 [Alligator mississippiensis]
MEPSEPHHDKSAVSSTRIGVGSRGALQSVSSEEHMALHSAAWRKQWRYKFPRGTIGASYMKLEDSGMKKSLDPSLSRHHIPTLDAANVILRISPCQGILHG